MTALGSQTQFSEPEFFWSAYTTKVPAAERPQLEQALVRHLKERTLSPPVLRVLFYGSRPTPRSLEILAAKKKLSKIEKAMTDQVTIAQCSCSPVGPNEGRYLFIVCYNDVEGWYFVEKGDTKR